MVFLMNNDILSPFWILLLDSLWCGAYLFCPFFYRSICLFLMNLLVTNWSNRDNANFSGLFPLLVLSLSTRCSQSNYQSLFLVTTFYVLIKIGLPPPKHADTLFGLRSFII